MAFNVCVNCGTNLSHVLGVYEIEMENYLIQLRSNKQPENNTQKDEKEYFNNLFFVKHHIDRMCCRAYIISFLDYIPSNM